MIKITLLLICLPLSIVVGAQTIAWSSDSEDTTGWSINDLDGDTFNWGLYGSGFENEGFNSGALFFSKSWDSEPAPNGTALSPDNLLFTPTFTVPLNAATITYKMKVGAIDSNFFAEKFAVLVYDDADFDASLTLIHEETLTAGGTASAKDITAEIPVLFAGKTIGIIIRHFDCTNQNQLLADDFQVSYTTSLSVEENQLSKLKVYPNPTKNLIKIDTNAIINMVYITNQLGQRVMEINKSNLLDNKVDLSHLSKGFYNMTISSENKSKTIKIIKE